MIPWRTISGPVGLHPFASLLNEISVLTRQFLRSPAGASTGLGGAHVARDTARMEVQDFVGAKGELRALLGDNTSA